MKLKIKLKQVGDLFQLTITHKGEQLVKTSGSLHWCQRILEKETKLAVLNSLTIKDTAFDVDDKKTYAEWNALGFKIIRGARAINGRFKYSQVESKAARNKEIMERNFAIAEGLCEESLQ
jgi:hypothetical protein